MNISDAYSAILSENGLTAESIPPIPKRLPGLLWMFAIIIQRTFSDFKLFFLCFKYLVKICLKFSYVNLIPEFSEKYLTKRFLKCIIVSVQ